MNNPLLRIANITKKFGSFYALKDVSFDIMPGEILGLLGVNGAGKTTLSTILATLHPPTSGDVTMDGVSIYDNIPEFRRMIGYCTQKPNLNPLLKVRDNLIFAGHYFGMTREEIDQRLIELNEHLGINEYLDFYPDALSGGWKQRYMIARTLMHKPKFIILDEPTVALDPDIRHHLWDYISFVRSQGTSILLTTHYLEEAEKLADRVCVLNKGEIQLIDTPQNLLKSFAMNNLEDVFLQLTENKKKGS